jgi:Holliday junction resolvase RusA-like endonuclease
MTHPLKAPDAPTNQRPHELTVTVYGTPAPQGSKKIVGRGGRSVLVDDNAERLHTWREDVKHAALRMLEVTPGWDGSLYPIIVGHFTFTMPRPKSHYRQGLQTSHLLRDAAPKHLHGTKPDLDKLLRSTWDALGSAGVYVDDARVAQVWATKAYPSARGLPPGTLDRPGARIHLMGVSH